jgi:general secretion pathway protein G
MKRKTAEAGFSLMELLVVMTILGLLAGVVAVSLTGRVDKEKRRTAKLQIANFEEALDMFHLDVGRYPTTEEGLAALIEKPSGVDNWGGRYLKKDLPRDPWKKEYIYKSPGDNDRPYDIMSYGMDGAPGGDGNNKDITSWQDLDATQ